MAELKANIPQSLKTALDTEATRIGRPVSSVMTSALSEFLGVPVHTLFQVSISRALVAGVYDRELSVRSILDHGDLGLGKFAHLDGEMVLLDGKAYQVTDTGHVSEATAGAGVPFAVVTRFRPQVEIEIGPVANFRELQTRCDKFRNSGNIFYAMRLDGHFSRLRTRVVNPSQPGNRIAEVARTQSEFSYSDVDGTLVGIWSPGFSSAFSVPGYHFHFLSGDRHHGGHVLAVEAALLHLRVEALTEFHLAVPESEAFLKADLSRNTAEEPAYADQAQ